MMMDPKKISEAIREKKKKLMMSEPEVGSSDPTFGMNAQDVEDTKQLGRIEATLDVPMKSNSDDAMADMSQSDADTAGLTAEEKSRMGRLRSYFDKMDMY